MTDNTKFTVARAFICLLVLLNVFESLSALAADETLHCPAALTMLMRSTEAASDVLKPDLLSVNRDACAGLRTGTNRRRSNLPRKPVVSATISVIFMFTFYITMYCVQWHEGATPTVYNVNERT
jgi:hypothetical protein